jgi:hypothetical protein
MGENNGSDIRTFTISNEEIFFPDTPEEVFLAVERVRLISEGLRAFIRESLVKFDLVVGQANRPDRMYLLVEGGVIPSFDYFFTGSKQGQEFIAKNWVEREVIDNTEEQIPYIWDSPNMWKKFWQLLDKNKDKKILLISAAPHKEHKRLIQHPNVVFVSPKPDLAVLFEYDKRHMFQLYDSIGIEYNVCNYDSSDEVFNGYSFHVKQLCSSSLVVQATQGSGGVTAKSSIQALFFVNDEESFKSALLKLKGEGPLRVMKKYDGISSNTGALALPFGIFISGIPTIKPCGLAELGALPGTGGGNQWDLCFSISAIDSQFDQLRKVGNKMVDSGYYGVFGLEPIMPITPDGTIFNSEINARSQGTDSQRTWVANRAGIASIEEMQLAYYLGCPAKFFPKENDYNLVTQWMKIPPYLKLFPKKDQIVRKDFNGYWKWDKVLLQTNPQNAHFRISGAPKVGQKILQSSPDNFLYVKFFDVDMKVFTQGENPKLTLIALEIVNYLYANI